MKPTVIRLTKVDRKRVEKLREWGYGHTLAGVVREAILARYDRIERDRSVAHHQQCDWRNRGLPCNCAALRLRF